MKTWLVILLVVLVVVTGMPVLVGMNGMAMCHDCGPAIFTGVACLSAILAGAVALLVALLAQRLRHARDRLAARLHSFRLERPPRFA